MLPATIEVPVSSTAPAFSNWIVPPSEAVEAASMLKVEPVIVRPEIEPPTDCSESEPPPVTTIPGAQELSHEQPDTTLGAGQPPSCWSATVTIFHGAIRP